MCTCTHTSHGFLRYQVICDTYSPKGEPLPSNNRARAARIFETEEVAMEEPWYVVLNINGCQHLLLLTENLSETDRFKRKANGSFSKEEATLGRENLHKAAVLHYGISP